MKRSVALVALTVILGFVLLLPASALGAERSMQFSDALVTLTDKPCEIGVILAEIDDPKLRKMLKHGTVVFEKGSGQPDRKLCYLEEGGLIGMIDDTGQQNVIPSAVFDAPKPKGNVSI